MSMPIKGERVGLLVRRQTGEDAFKRPVYTDEVVQIDNVVIAPGGSSDAVTETNVTGMRERCTLYIPKNDAHEWENTQVEFWGERWRTVGRPKMYQQALVPLAWNKVVEVERHE